MKHRGTKERLKLALYVWLFALASFPVGCDRVRQLSPAKTEATALSMESLLDRMVTKDKDSVEEAHKKGRSTIVGLWDGKTWLGNNDAERRSYIIGIADLVSALGIIVTLTLDEATDQEKKKDLEFLKGQTTYAAVLESQYKSVNRIREVTGRRPFGDIIDAVTQFYEKKPLLRDKPVVWVLGFALYKEIQDAKSKEEKNTDNDTVELVMKKK